MRSPQNWGGYSHWGSRVVLTFPLEWPGPSPFGGLQGNSEQEPCLDKLLGGPDMWPHLPRASRGS